MKRTQHNKIVRMKKIKYIKEIYCEKKQKKQG